MGIFGELFGLGSKIDKKKLREEFEPILVEGEQIENAFKVLRDLMVFTNKRLVLVNKQGMTAKKRNYLTIPYHSITKFAKESLGHFDKDAELKLWVRGERKPIIYEFSKDESVHEIYRVLGKYILI